MAKSAEVDDPATQEVAGVAGATGAVRVKSRPPDNGVPPLRNGERRAEVEAELRRWYAMAESEREQELDNAVHGARDWSPEVFVHVSNQAYAQGGRQKFNQAFEPFVKRVTPLLLSQAWGDTKKRTTNGQFTMGMITSQPSEFDGGPASYNAPTMVNATDKIASAIKGYCVHRSGGVPSFELSEARATRCTAGEKDPRWTFMENVAE